MASMRAVSHSSFLSAGHHTKGTRLQPARRVAVLLAAAALTALASPAFAAGKAGADPFAGDIWHAVTPSWPGTIAFDGKAHTVVLAPLGAQPIRANYSYTLKPAASGSKSLDGELRMTNTQGQTSNSTFHLENGKKLTLTFPGGVQSENYVRMTPAEEAAESRRLQQMMAQGKLTPLAPPQTKELK